MTIEELQYKTIDRLKFVLIAFIVFCHCHFSHYDDLWVWNYFGQNNFLNLSGQGVYALAFTLSSNIGTIFVLCFFMFSGYLFFHKTKTFDRKLYVKKVQSRVKTLVIPYLMWIIIPIVSMALLYLIRFDGSLARYVDKLSESGLLSVFWDSVQLQKAGDIRVFRNAFTYSFPHNVPLWYIRDLIMLVFLSPLVYYFVKYTKLIGIGILGVLFFAKYWIYTPGITGFSIEGIFFFCLGAFLGIYGKSMIVEFRKGKNIWLAVTILSLILTMYFEGKDYLIRYCFYRVLAISLTITIINITSAYIERCRFAVDHPFISYLSKSSFYVYATHWFFVGWSWKIVKFLIGSDGIIKLVNFFIVPVVCLGLCVGSYYVIEKIAPKVLRILTGSR